MSIYAVQNWVDADGVNDGWNTGNGYYTSSLSDAKKELTHLGINYPHTTFRLAVAEIGEWTALHAEEGEK